MLHFKLECGPFKVYIEDTSTLLVMMSVGNEDLSINTPPQLASNVPHTREQNQLKKEKREQTAAAIAAKAPIQTHIPPGVIPIPDLIRIAKKVCDTRVALLSLKTEVSTHDDEKERYFKERIDSYNRFLIYINTFKGSIKLPQNHLIFLEHEYNACQDISTLLEGLGFFYVTAGKNDDYMQSVGTRRTYLERHLDATQELLKIDPNNATLKKTRITLLDGLFSLWVVDYTYYVTVNVEKAQTAYTAAQLRNTQLRDIGERDLYTKNRASLESLQLKKLTPQAVNRFVDTAGKFEEEKGRDAFYSEHRTLISVLDQALQDQRLSPEKFRSTQDHILRFENHLIGQQGASPLSADQLDEFYVRYKTQLYNRSHEVHILTKPLVGFLITTGQFEHAINHITAFKKVYDEVDQEAVLRAMDLQTGILKALLGFPEDFLEITQFYAQKDKQAYQQRQEERRKIKEHQRAKVVEAAKSAQRASEETKAPPKQPSKPSFPTPAAPTASSFFPQEQNLTDTKEAKEQRHLESLERKKREEQEGALAAQLRVEHDQGAAAAAAEPDHAQTADLREIKFFPFDEEIRRTLTTLQRRVEREIEADSWNFTREELKAYYEGFGCKTRQRGSHVTASLPKFEVVELPDGTPMVVNFNFDGFALQGGSFTFGEWRDQVPHYLQSQILEARRRIQHYKRNVHDQVAKATQDQDDE